MITRADQPDFEMAATELGCAITTLQCLESRGADLERIITTLKREALALDDIIAARKAES